MTTHSPQSQPFHPSDANMTVVVNGQEHPITAQSNLQQIIEQLGLPELGCVFAINNTVVPRSEWSRTVLSEGDSISLFQAIAGG